MLNAQGWAMVTAPAVAGALGGVGVKYSGGVSNPWKGAAAFAAVAAVATIAGILAGYWAERAQEDAQSAAQRAAPNERPRL